MIGVFYEYSINHPHEHCEANRGLCSYANYLDLNMSKTSAVLKVIEKTGTWTLVFTQFVPISLMV